MLPNFCTPFGLEHILIVPFLASAHCQAFLLSVWGAASQAPPWKRLAGLVAGAVYLEALFAANLRSEFLGICTVTIAVATASLLVVQWCGVRLKRHADPGQPARPEPDGLRLDTALSGRWWLNQVELATGGAAK